MTDCTHKHPDGTCRRYPPVFVARNGSYVTEWPKPISGCVCGEHAPKPEKEPNPAPEPATKPQRAKRAKSKGGEVV